MYKSEKMLRALVGLVTFAIMITVSEGASKCYQCIGCPEPFNLTSYNSDCPSDNYSCYTLEIGQLIQKGCVHKEACYPQKGLLDCCDTDLCNNYKSGSNPTMLFSGMNSLIISSFVILFFTLRLSY